MAGQGRREWGGGLVRATVVTPPPLGTAVELLVNAVRPVHSLRMHGEPSHVVPPFWTS